MSSDLEKCEVQALKLSPKERAVLAEHLIASIDPLDDAENERLWLEEADRRYWEYKMGNISARPAEDVLRDARHPDYWTNRLQVSNGAVENVKPQMTPR